MTSFNDMDAERWRRVSALYHAAAAQQGADRVAFLVDACAGDEELRREVESLLKSQSSAEQFLAAPAFDIAAQLDDSPAAPAATRRRIGVYELRERIGVGGMGEVYRARDMRLGRDVAVKILPGAFATDPERIARFEREARVLAALNHTNIATLYGVEESDGVRALAIELVEGTTLSERLSQGSLPMRDALAVSRQIADALEAAHEKGIIHRDLKPANIKITSTGLVKLLDFGLAKAMDADAARNLSQMPTMTVGTTGQGAIVGTAAYMSPEQARGQPVDKRTDIWAFGCVLFEMLTGRPAFARHTLSDTLARILGSDPDWDGLPDSTPASLRRLLQRCLEKDSKRRIHDIADARIEIEDALASPTRAELSATTAAPAARWRAWNLALGALVLVAAAVTIGYVVSLPPAPASREPLRFSIPLLPGEQLPIDTGLPVSVAISPAGDQIVYAARTTGGDRLYLRRLGDLEAVPIQGTEGAIGPFFSPDGQWIAFASGGMLRTVPISGGVPRAVAAAPNLAGASWGAGGLVVFSNWNSGLLKVSPKGGMPEPLTTLVPQEGEIGHGAPHVLPQDRFVLFSVRRRTGSFVEAVEVATGSRRPILEGRNPIYLPSGHLVFARGAAVFAVPFDLARLERSGPELRLLDDVRTDGNDTHFAVARDGTLAYLPGLSRNSRLMWIDRHGAQRPLDGERRPYVHPRISPDGRRVVLTILSDTGASEIWIYDAARGNRVRLSPSGTRPIWTADGQAITFQMEGNLYSAPADDSSAPRPLFRRDERFSTLFPLAWSRDGGLLMFSAPVPATNRDVWIRRSDETIVPFLVTARDERAATFSPDGRWVVYAARETGREEQVYVQPYPGPGRREVVSPGGGVEPLWSPTGREIFYLSVDGTKMMSVDVGTEPTLTVGEPRELFAGRFRTADGSFWSNYDVSRDGQNLLMLEADEGSTPRVNVVVNWDRLLPQP